MRLLLASVYTRLSTQGIFVTPILILSYLNKNCVDIIMLSLQPLCNSFTGVPLIMLCLRSCLQRDSTAPNGSLTESGKDFEGSGFDVRPLNLSGGIVGKPHRG